MFGIDVAVCDTRVKLSSSILEGLQRRTSSVFSQLQQHHVFTHGSSMGRSVFANAPPPETYWAGRTTRNEFRVFTFLVSTRYLTHAFFGAQQKHSCHEVHGMH